MQKTYFHNYKQASENKVKKKYISSQYTDQMRIVDINKLLNRVRIEKKIEVKRKIIFFSSVILAFGLFSTFVTTVN